MISVHSFTFNGFQENTFVLVDRENEALIIDPGCYDRGEQEQLRSFIEERELRPVRLVNTHFHLDHILGNAFVSRTYGLAVESHRAGLPVLEMADVSAQLYGFTGYEPSPTPQVFWEEGDIIPFGGGLKVLFVPGHSPGHIALVSEEDGFVVGGDVLFNGSIGRTDLPGGSMPELERSIREKMYTLPDEYTVYCGHGPETTIGHEKRTNPFVRA